MGKKRNKKSINRHKKLAEARNQKFVLDEPVYAKLTGFCPWPAKITFLFERWCDVFFFGVPKEQSRGINIQLEQIKKISNSEHMKLKYLKRKGFSKAQNEMEWYIKQIKQSGNPQNKRKTSCAIGLRRSARIQAQAIEIKSNISAGIRRSTRIAQLRKK